MVFAVLGPQILNLKIEYHKLSRAGGFVRILTKFPHLLHLSVPAMFMARQADDHIDLGFDHPLRSITINVSWPEDPDLLSVFNRQLLDKYRWPNVESVILSNKSPVDRWITFLRNNTRAELSDMLRFLERWSDSSFDSSSDAPSDDSSGLKKSATTKVWLEDDRYDGDYTTSFQLTEENLSRIRRRLPPL
jgi:hypothetical protein